MLPWQELALKVAVTARALAVVLRLAGLAFMRNDASALRALRTGAIVLGVLALLAGGAARRGLSLRT